MADKWTASDIPRQDGRVAIVTGANSGLGFETARELARHGAVGAPAIAVAAHPGGSDTDLMRHLPAALRALWSVSEELTGVTFPV